MSGLSQYNRAQRVANRNHFAIIDSRVESLLRQAKEIASFIRYYNLNAETDGYFGQFLQDLEHMSEDGNQEPSQALLFTFIQQLSEITTQFNRRWDNYINWYFENILKANKLPAQKHKICLAFNKNTDQTILLKKGLGFRLKTQNSPVYKLTEESFIENTSIENIFTIHFCKQKNIFPAAQLDFVTSLKVKNLLHSDNFQKELFDTQNNANNQNNGFMISSPSLLLREGKRTVSIDLLLENNQDAEDFFLKIKESLKNKPAQTNDFIDYHILNNIFHLQISRENGWIKIANYTIKKEEDSLKIKFTLAEDFPSTTPCQKETHNFESAHPAIKIYLNRDAWLHPYSWLKKLLLKKIHISTEVEGINNILVYNDLGKIDSSKPFAPFGINTEKGAWISIGNYEVALKNTQNIDLHIQWGQLPECPNGLHEYYAAYNKNIDNDSFRIQAKYLSGYQWKNIDTFSLFESNPDFSLSRKTTFHAIDIAKMATVKNNEELYDYNIRTKTGFVNFTLVAPDIGFGEKYYRNLFTDYMFLKKKKGKESPNTPISPIIERITLDYVSTETIDLRSFSSNSETIFYHISPFGIKQMHPGTDNSFIPVIFSMESDANLIIELKNAHKGGVLSLYFDFVPSNKTIIPGQIPQVKWQLGNGYQWENIPDGYLGEDKTMNLLVNGFLKIYLPKTLDHSLYLDNGNIYLRAAIEKNEAAIPAINNIYINVSEAQIDIDDTESNTLLLQAGELLVAEENIAGLSETEIIASYDTFPMENTEKCMMRISEYATHRGKAVTARDYERITLQAFTDIAKVKCMPGTKEAVTIAIIPQKTSGIIDKYYMQKATSRQILKVKKYLTGRTSTYVKKIEVINPLYEEVTIRCHAVFDKKHSSAVCRSRLSDILDKKIAPWQQENQLPLFDYSIDLEAIYESIMKLDFIENVEKLSAIIISEKDKNTYTLEEYSQNNNRIKPSKPFAIFVPAKEHLITASPSDTFGIDEMTINQTMIVS
jgi:hypothetical protein